MSARATFELDGWGTLDCGCKHGVRLICEEAEGYEPGTTIWTHGASGEAAMVVTIEMRQQWAEEKSSGVREMFRWIDRVHEYGRGAEVSPSHSNL